MVLVFIILIGYLYVLAMVCASMELARGLTWFVLLGVLPTWLILWSKLRSLRQKRANQAERAADQGDQPS